ncbi:MAG TPA: hypothetical protein VKA19_09640, partial [Alphaproteobacteria bacterium]|nr:hypothetical protein [Alphaproteobacteria bacterium]
IDDLRSEAATLESAPVPLETAERRIDARIEALKKDAVLAGADFTTPGYRPDENSKPIDLPLLAAIAPGALKEAWLAEAQDWLEDHPPGPDLETRRARLAEIGEQLDGMIRRHTALVFEAWNRDIRADFLSDVPATILLAVEGERDVPSTEPRMTGKPGHRLVPEDPTVIRA